jgi:hypothetical protein
MSRFILSLVCLFFAFFTSGCGTSSNVPKTLMWNVTVDSIPQGAELTWSRYGDSTRHPLGTGPVEATIPIPVSDGLFSEIYIEAIFKGSRTSVRTSKLLNQTSVPQIHDVNQASRLPSKVTVNIHEASKFDVPGGLSLFREFEKNPERWSRYVSAIEGKVLRIDESTSGCVVQLLVHKEKSAVVYWPKDSMNGVVEGADLKVLGNVVGKTTGPNAFGGTVSSLTFKAYAYSVNWFMPNGRTDYELSKKAYFDRWAEGSLFVGDWTEAPQAE